MWPSQGPEPWIKAHEQAGHRGLVRRPSLGEREEPIHNKGCLRWKSRGQPLCPGDWAETDSSAAPGALWLNEAWFQVAGVTAHTHSGEVARPAGPDFPAWGWTLTKPSQGSPASPDLGSPGL